MSDSLALCDVRDMLVIHVFTLVHYTIFYFYISNALELLFFNFPFSSNRSTIATIRTQLLLNQYVSALLGSVGKSSSASPSSPADSKTPKTQDIINGLVYSPLGNPRGYGCMAVIRYVQVLCIVPTSHVMRTLPSVMNMHEMEV